MIANDTALPGVTELTVISFASGRPALVETAPGVSVQQVLVAIEAELVPRQASQMRI